MELMSRGGGTAASEVNHEWVKADMEPSGGRG
jgi:hypothetical protein